MSNMNIQEITEKCRIEKLQALPKTNIPCLDKGYVEIVDWLGTDHDLCESARVSYQKGTKKSSNDEALLSHLIRNKHTSPLEQANIKFQIKAPIFVIIQLLRHRTLLFSQINSESARYSELKDEFYLPELDRLQVQSKTNKQGSEINILPENIAKNIQSKMEQEQRFFKLNYDSYLAEDLARELARNNAPVSTFMTFVVKFDLHNLLHFLQLRQDSHAQYEIRVYADAINELITPIFPLAMKYYDEHILNAVTFDRTELGIIKEIILEYNYLLKNYLNSTSKDSIEILAKNNDLKGSRLKEFLAKLGLQ